ncbi:MAG: glycosyltransferase [Polaromonas sp.]|nr:MAG: glycosyltransferase [Polaromonas sp.]
MSVLETDLLPYSSCLCIAAQAVLVLAPHPDDEVFGCGGAIASHIKAKQSVCVVILTDGGLFGDTTVRKLESQAAAAVLGYGLPEFWAFPDRGLVYSESLVRRLVNKIAATGSDLVYAPSPWEAHPDHRQTTLVAIEAVRRAGQTVRLAFYEVGAPLRPNVLLDITLQVEVKDKAMRCFTSQLVHQDYVQHIQALNRYRTYTLPRTVAAAEAYWVLSALDLVHIQPGGLWLPISPGITAELADMSNLPQQWPLVSILIRSLDRPYLVQALDSIALQNYPAIEVVVVAAVSDHENLPVTCGAFPLRLLATDSALARSKAANVAMAAAKGELLLLLDDDDWLMPGHIARLVRVLQRQPNVWAAYTGVALVDAQGATIGQAIDLPFDQVRQLAGNLTPIHAVMFRTTVQAQGCRFDETLDLYEDWDFWLQLSKLAPMVHLPGTSAVYRIHESSGVHALDGAASTAALAIQQKWAGEWTAQQFGQIMGRVWSYPELSANLNDSRRAVEDSQRSLLDSQRNLSDSQRNLSDSQRNLSDSQRNLSDSQRSLADALHGLADARHSLSDTQQCLADVRRQVALLNQDLMARDTLVAQHDLTIAAQQTHVDAAQAQAKELASQLAHQQQDNAALRQQMQEIAQNLAQEIARLERDRATLLNSRSWRITRPLRWAGSLTRKVGKI